MLPLAGSVYTVTPENARAMRAEALAEEAEECIRELGIRKVPVRACHSIKEAVELAGKNTPENGVILAFGSLSYLSEIKKNL